MAGTASDKIHEDYRFRVGQWSRYYRIRVGARGITMSHRGTNDLSCDVRRILLVCHTAVVLPSCGEQQWWDRGLVIEVHEGQHIPDVTIPEQSWKHINSSVYSRVYILPGMFRECEVLAFAVLHEPRSRVLDHITTVHRKLAGSSRPNPNGFTPIVCRARYCAATLHFQKVDPWCPCASWSNHYCRSYLKVHGTLMVRVSPSILSTG